MGRLFENNSQGFLIGLRGIPRAEPTVPLRPVMTPRIQWSQCEQEQNTRLRTQDCQALHRSKNGPISNIQPDDTRPLHDLI